MASDKYNALETELETDLNADSEITNKFNLIEKKFREDCRSFLKTQIPALSFEAVESSPSDESDHHRKIRVLFEVNNFCANMDTARQSIKELVSLVEDFLMTNSWTRAEETFVGRSGYMTEKDKNGFRVLGHVEAEIELLLTETTVK